MKKTKLFASVLLASAMLSACGGDSKPTDSADSVSVAEVETEATVAQETESNVPTEYKSALKKSRKLQQYDAHVKGWHL